MNNPDINARRASDKDPAGGVYSTDGVAFSPSA